MIFKISNEYNKEAARRSVGSRLRRNVDLG